MRRVPCLFLLLCFFTEPLRANLGETVKECVVRYGRPSAYAEANSDSPLGRVVFTAGGFVLVIFVYNDREVGARVTKSDKSAFSDTDLQAVMGADAAGSNWTACPSDDPTCRAWQRGDKAKVLYDQVQHMVIFSSVTMDNVMKTAPSKPAPTGSAQSGAGSTHAVPAVENTQQK